MGRQAQRLPPARQGSHEHARPTAALAQFRRIVLGVDTRGNAFGVVRDFPRWNLDSTVTKQIRINERVNASFTALLTNVLNHMQPDTPSSNIDTPAQFGRVTAALESRQMEFGLRINW